MHNLKHNKVLHERVVMMCVKTEPSPRVAPAQRYEIHALSPDFVTVTLRFGYMEPRAFPPPSRPCARSASSSTS